jgi:hypothetical protein
MITVHLESVELTRTLAGLTRLSQRPRSLLQAAARALRRDLQRHFRDRDRTPNKLGGQRTHWWARVARSTQIASVTDTQAVVSISEPGIGIKVTGGVIRPVEAGALTIPIHPEAHGRRAKTVELITGHKLFRVRPKGSPHTFLARSLGDDTIRLLYVLKQSARVPADPQALPDRAALERGAVAAAADQLRSEVRRAQLT